LVSVPLIQYLVNGRQSSRQRVSTVLEHIHDR
jgi:hypothetical protein